MKQARFTQSFDISNGTSNISYLLDAEHEIFLNTFTPAMVEDVFGPGDDSCDEISKGYTDPEWYWQSSDGCVWGVGWRWGAPRLRGKGVQKPGQMVSHPDKLSAYEFIEFIKESMSNA